MRCALLILVTACLYSAQAATTARHSRQPLADRRLVDVIATAGNTSVLAGPRLRRQTRCRSDQWRCRDGHCIDIDGPCDGAANCPDGSDETQALCEKKSCPAHLFRCSYGACVDGDAECNGVQDCADNSDEENKNCRKGGPVVNNCGTNRWQCDDGQCIDALDVCDGRAHCADRSDETVAQCYNSKDGCKSFLVRCAYGACVDGGAECNNTAECADGSDEAPAKCAGKPGWVSTVTFTSRPFPTPLHRNRSQSVPPVSGPSPTPTYRFQTQPMIPSTGSAEGCKLPNFPYDGRYTVSNSDVSSPGAVVVAFTFLSYTCEKDYDLTVPFAVCQDNNTWSAAPRCNKRCTMPTSSTVDFTCYYLTDLISCSSTLPEGSTVHSRCKSFHTTVEDLLVLTCHGGSWDNPTPKCILDCGLEPALGITHIVYGTRVKKNRFPWHVAIFQDRGNPVPEQVCGGTLVRAHVVISAAHCFYNSKLGRQIDRSFYKVACGKLFRSWTNEDDEGLSYVQKSEVKKILLHEYYTGEEQNQGNDVAIVVLATPFKLSDSVRPVCIDLNREELDKIQVGSGKLGKVAGWGVTENGQPSEELLSLNLPVIEYNECRLEMKKYNFQRYVTRDKLCAGYLNGSALCRGDSGGGLVFSSLDLLEKTRWYLRGVVSVGPSEEAKPCRASTYTAFTEIFKLKDWLSPQLRKLG